MSYSNNISLENYQSLINNYLKSIDIKPQCEQVNVYKAISYSLMAGGKRLRPVLMLEFYRMCGGKDDILPVACSIEMIHTFSLIHDDLPCMDDDDYRRGQLSCHKKYGEAVALLAGDALSVLPYEIITKQAMNGSINYERAVKVIEILTKAVGAEGMIGGQVIDIELENKQADTMLLEKLDSLKTGAIISAACMCGCVLAGADEEKVNIAKQYGLKIGLAFQIVDDILDVTGNFESLGKLTNSDEKQDKNTFVSLLGLEKSKLIADRLTKEAVKLLDNFENNEFMKDLTVSLLNRNK